MTVGRRLLHANLTDDDFDSIYPRNIRKLASKHWTPISVARDASAFLVNTPGTKVLDIGSGAGKFCMIGSLHTAGDFTGIEQRLELVNLSIKLTTLYSLNNVTFINTNITSVDLTRYDAFYIYNSFFENIDAHDRIDNTVLVNSSLYNSYSMYMKRQLTDLPINTRLATYYTATTMIPENFKLVESCYDGNLSLWEKIA